MKLITIAIAVTCSFCFAQNGDDSQPASSNIMGAEYPRVHADLSASFRLQAPDARKVVLDIMATKYDMAKGGDGSWTARTKPLVPGFHYYQLWVDGVSMNDPGSETFFGVGRQFSGIEIPEKGADFYDPKDVPHGDIREHWYHSRITG